MSFLQLAKKIATADHVQGGKARIGRVEQPRQFPANRPSRAKLARITRPGNSMAAGRSFMESPKRPPLSEGYDHHRS